MLKYTCLVLDHDDTVVQSELTINYPYFCYILDQFRPGTKITLEEYITGCSTMGFADMCRQKYHFTERELVEEYTGWKEYIRTHIPAPYPGIGEIIHRQKAAGGILCVVSHSSAENITRDYQHHFNITPDDIYGWDYPEHQRKPHAYPLLQIINKYALKPNDILVVDDMKPAFEMSSKAGCPIAFAGWGKKDFPQVCKQMQELCNFSFYSTADLEKFLFD